MHFDSVRLDSSVIGIQYICIHQSMGFSKFGFMDSVSLDSIRLDLINMSTVEVR